MVWGDEGGGGGAEPPRTTRIRRRAFVAGLGCALVARPAAAAFPDAQPWRFKLGPIEVPFVLTGRDEDVAAFSAAMRQTLYDVATRDVPQVLKPTLGAYKVYVGRLGHAASAILAADVPARSVGGAALTAAIADPARRKAYATVAGTAALVRWRAATVAAILEPAAGALANQAKVEFPLLFEAEGIAFGEALLELSHNPARAQRPPGTTREMAPWQVAIVERQLRETFSGLVGTGMEAHARSIELALGYAEAILRGPRHRPDPQEAAATAYAGALFANAATPLWRALAV